MSDHAQPAEPEVDVSVVVPAYRAAGFIDRAIDSALDQEGVVLEVVVVDDACPIGTGDAVEQRYGARGDVVVLRLAQNSGPAAARNAGIEVATGRWVAILDADDAFEPRRLARLVRYGEQLGADVVADNVRFHDTTTGLTTEPRIRSVQEPTQLDLHTFLDRGRPGTGELDFGLLKPLFRRRSLLETGVRYPEDVRHGEDFLLYLELIRRGARFVVVPEAGYLWTVRSSGLSQTGVDYPAQVADVRRLQAEEWVREDSRVVELLDARAEALDRLRASRAFSDALRSRRYGEVAVACARHPYLLRQLGRSLLGWVRRSMGGVAGRSGRPGTG